MEKLGFRPHIFKGRNPTININNVYLVLDWKWNLSFWNIYCGKLFVFYCQGSFALLSKRSFWKIIIIFTFQNHLGISNQSMKYSFKVEEVLCVVNPNSLAPFFVSSLSPRKGRGQKMGVPPGFRTGDPPHHNALFTHGTPPGCRCPGSDFVPIWDPLLWRNGT